MANVCCHKTVIERCDGCPYDGVQACDGPWEALRRDAQRLDMVQVKSSDLLRLLEAALGVKAFDLRLVGYVHPATLSLLQEHTNCAMFRPGDDTPGSIALYAAGVLGTP